MLAAALGGLTILAAFLLGINVMNVVNSYVGRDFMTALAAAKPRGSLLSLASLPVCLPCPRPWKCFRGTRSNG